MSARVAKKNFGECPECGSKHTTITNYEFDVCDMWLSCQCYRCDSTWSEHGLLIYDGYNKDGIYYDKDGEQLNV